MPAKNSIKIYVENSYYHVYNRGVEKRTIFQDEQDYKVFLNYLKEYLSPIPKPEDRITKPVYVQGQTFNAFARLPNNYYEKINLIAYCLMPNHFHLILKQKDKKIMTKFMQSLITRYSIYFNKKYKRVGSLFQGRYKAALVDNENYLLHLSRYIHLNPYESSKDLTIAHSSYSEYLMERKTEWVKPEAILSYFDQAKSDFKKTNSYKDFVEKYDKNSASILEKLTLED